MVATKGFLIKSILSYQRVTYESQKRMQQLLRARLKKEVGLTCSIKIKYYEWNDGVTIYSNMVNY